MAQLTLSDLKAILFDFDGTLVDVSIDFEAMKQRVWLAAVATGLDLAGYERLYTLELIRRVFAALGGDGAAPAEAFRRQAEEAVLDEELRAAARAEVFPGVPAFLQELHGRGIKVVIVTRNCRAAVEQIIARHDLYYDLLLTRDDVPRVKPDPEHLAIALRALGISAREALMVGDHPMDVQAGHAVGAWTIGILDAGRPADYFAAVHPHAVLASVVAIPAYIMAHPLQDSQSGVPSV